VGIGEAESHDPVEQEEVERGVEVDAHSLDHLREVASARGPDRVELVEPQALRVGLDAAQDEADGERERRESASSSGDAASSSHAFEGSIEWRLFVG
jgi:hypothetical protein